MTYQRVKRLLWRGEAKWLLPILIAFIGIGIVAGYVSVQDTLQNLREIPHFAEQFFTAESQRPNGVLVRSEILVSHYLYFVAIFVGLLSAFWGRRTHYFEFLLNLGATRGRIFRAQCVFGSILVAVGTLLAELAEYSMIFLMLPHKSLQYVPYQFLLSRGLASIAVALLLFSLGLLIGNLSDHFTFAVILSLLIWRPFFDYFDDRSGLLIKVKNQDLWVWFWLHRYWSLTIALIAASVVLVLGYLLFRRWSAESDRQLFLFPGLSVVNMLLTAWAFGTLSGQFFLSVFRTAGTGSLIGFIMAVVIGVIWLTYRYFLFKGGRQSVNN